MKAQSMNIIKMGASPCADMGFLIVIMLTLVLATIAVLIFVYNYKPSIFTTMGEYGFDWLQEKAIGWSHTPPVNKIDTHHHCVPPFYAKGEIVISVRLLVTHD